MTFLLPLPLPPTPPPLSLLPLPPNNLFISTFIYLLTYLSICAGPIRHDRQPRLTRARQTSCRVLLHHKRQTSIRGQLAVVSGGLSSCCCCQSYKYAYSYPYNHIHSYFHSCNNYHINNCNNYHIHHSISRHNHHWLSFRPTHQSSRSTCLNSPIHANHPRTIEIRC